MFGKSGMIIRSLFKYFRGKIGFATLITKKTKFAGKNKIGKFSSFKDSEIGYGSYIGDNCRLSGCRIGKYCSIGNSVKLISGAHPTNSNISTHPAFYSVNNVPKLSYVNENSFEEHKHTADGFCISIGNDVWIGSDVCILEGVKISDGAIIAAGAVVVSDVPPYAVIGGVPAKVIKYRFSPEQIEALQNMQWWNFDEIQLKSIAKDFKDPRHFFGDIINEGLDDGESK